MNFLWMEYFIAVAESGSIRSAARQLYITEQAVSEALRKLQKELNIDLFTPTRPRSLSPAGEVFYRYAQTTIRQKTAMLRELETLSVREQNTLRIGLPLQGCPPFLDDICQHFLAEHPQYQIKTVQMVSNTIADFRGADLYILPTPLENCTMPYAVIFQDRFCLAVRQDVLDGLFGQEVEAICRDVEAGGSMEPLSALTQICLKQDFMPAIEKRLGFHPKAEITAPTVLLAISLCLDGYGAMFTMERDFKIHLQAYPAEKRRGIRLIPLSYDASKLGMSIGYDKELTPVAALFLQGARDFFREDSPDPASAPDNGIL